MRRIFLLFLLVLAPGAQAAPGAVPALHLRVTDLTHTLSVEARHTLNNTLASLENKTGHQFAVLIVPTTGEESIEQYAIRVFEQWKLGDKKRDDGVLLLVAKLDHTLRIEVGYGLEGQLTDLQASQIIRQRIVPWFKKGNYSQGIQAGAEAISLCITDPERDSSQFARSSTQQKDQRYDTESFGFLGWILGMTFIPGLLRNLSQIKRNLYTSLIVSAGTGILRWSVGNSPGDILLGMLTAFIGTFLALIFWSGRSGGGGGLTGRGRSSGGFSGGGGNSGGGGASGRW